MPKLFAKVRVLDFEEWLEGTTYDENRKNQLRVVREKLRGGRPTKKQCSRVDSFVKNESYDAFKHARMINSRCDAFKVYSGPMFKAIENEVYKNSWFIKHVPVPERPDRVAAMKKAGLRYWSTDFTAFESHFTPLFLRICECEVYKHCLANYEGAGDFITDVLTGENKMRTRSGISASVKGRRMSGDMCTSLGNGLANFMLINFIAHEKGGKVDGFVEGDDGLFATDFEIRKEDYEDLGFTIKVEELSDPSEASFCGMIFSESKEIIKNPRKFLQTFGWTTSYIHAGPKIMDSLLRAKALSAVYELPQCPVIGAIARRALRDTEGSAPRFVASQYQQEKVPRDTLNLKPFRPNMITRNQFARVYGISVDDQFAIEEAATAGDSELVAQLLPATPQSSWFGARFIEVT